MGVFVVTRISARSVKTESATLSDDSIKLVVDGDREYSASSEASTALMGKDGDGQPFFLRDLNPDQTIRGSVAFDIPKSALGKKLQLRFNELGFGSTHAFINLPPLS